MANTNADGGRSVSTNANTSPDPNQIAKASQQTQTVVTEHTSRILALEALVSKLIKKNSLKT